MTTKATHRAAPKSHGVAEKVSHLAQTGARKATVNTKRMLRLHPLASFGVVLGSGVVLGAVARSLFVHKPTWGELLVGRAGLNRLRHLGLSHRS